MYKSNFLVVHTTTTAFACVVARENYIWVMYVYVQLYMCLCTICRHYQYSRRAYAKVGPFLWAHHCNMALLGKHTNTFSAYNLKSTYTNEATQQTTHGNSRYTAIAWCNSWLAWASNLYPFQCVRHSEKPGKDGMKFQYLYGWAVHTFICCIHIHTQSHRTVDIL